MPGERLHAESTMLETAAAMSPLHRASYRHFVFLLAKFIEFTTLQKF